MDINDINKVANRKRLNVDAEKLREKVSRETAKIIKLKVAQDTAYWDLKEKLQQVESNHERLQQNMVEVQMQHEAIAGQYQDELRLRPETLNKMSSTREICDVLEEYSTRLKDTLSRCKRDQAALCDAYQRSGRLVRHAQLQRARTDDEHARLVQRLEDRLKLTGDHHNQLMQYFTTSKQQLDAELSDTKQKLSAAVQQKDELINNTAELRRQLDSKQHDLQAKEEAVASLQKDIKQLLQEFNMQAGDMKNTLHKQEKEIKESHETNEALKKALENQEEFTKTIHVQNSNLQEKISCLEDEHAVTISNLKDTEAKLQIASSEIESLKKDIQIVNDKKQGLENVIKAKDDLLVKYEKEVEQIKSHLRGVEGEKDQVSSELSRVEDEGKLKAARVEELETSLKVLQTKMADLQAELVKERETTAQKVSELTSSIQQKDKELDDNAGTIGRLMADVKAACEARARTELALQRSRHDHELDREAFKDNERKFLKQIEQLEGNVRSKDDELSKQMSIILEIRVEKERLQSKIEGMQGTIDNIQKELTGRTAHSVPAPPPEHDDNALMCPPTKVTKITGEAKLPAPNGEPKQLDNMLFSLFSDGSMDGDTIDPFEVNRRFDALSRGERVSPLPLGSLKRRAGVPISHGGLKHKTTPDVDNISLSQVKNDMKNKDKTFFKNKRLEPKTRKPK